jgi:hypothetical protein
MIWVIVGMIVVFVIIGLTRPKNNSLQELTDYQLQELERTKSNTLPPSDGGPSQ